MCHNCAGERLHHTSSPWVTTWLPCPTRKTQGLSSPSLSPPPTRDGGRSSRRRIRLSSITQPPMHCLFDRRLCNRITFQIPPSVRIATVHYQPTIPVGKTLKTAHPIIFNC